VHAIRPTNYTITCRPMCAKTNSATVTDGSVTVVSLVGENNV